MISTQTPITTRHQSLISTQAHRYGQSHRAQSSPSLPSRLTVGLRFRPLLSISRKVGPITTRLNPRGRMKDLLKMKALLLKNTTHLLITALIMAALKALKALMPSRTHTLNPPTGSLWSAKFVRLSIHTSLKIRTT